MIDIPKHISNIRWYDKINTTCKTNISNNIQAIINLTDNESNFLEYQLRVLLRKFYSLILKFMLFVLNCSNLRHSFFDKKIERDFWIPIVHKNKK